MPLRLQIPPSPCDETGDLGAFTSRRLLQRHIRQFHDVEHVAVILCTPIRGRPRTGIDQDRYSKVFGATNDSDRCLVASSGSADRPQPGADQAEHRRPKLCGRAVQRPRSSQLPQSRLSGATHEGGALCAAKPAITAQRARTSMTAKRHIGSVTRARRPSFALPGTFETNFVIDLHPPAGCRRRARNRASVSTMTRFHFRSGDVRGAGTGQLGNGKS